MYVCVFFFTLSEVICPVRFSEVEGSSLWLTWHTETGEPVLCKVHVLYKDKTLGVNCCNPCIYMYRCMTNFLLRRRFFFFSCIILHKSLSPLFPEEVLWSILTRWLAFTHSIWQERPHCFSSISHRASLKTTMSPSERQHLLLHCSSGDCGAAGCDSGHLDT